LPPGDQRLYDTRVLTEDNGLSLALWHLGYKIVSPKQCTLSPEVMEGWADLAKQRIRWKRGALENCRQYGLTRITLEYWYRQILSAIGIVAMRSICSRSRRRSPLPVVCTSTSSGSSSAACSSRSASSACAAAASCRWRSQACYSSR
jgi:cellulose synthase/poly-beta-1,6-N-acetylglucosamine synthase-like glycosyltransferase